MVGALPNHCYDSKTGGGSILRGASLMLMVACSSSSGGGVSEAGEGAGGLADVDGGGGLADVDGGGGASSGGDFGSGAITGTGAAQNSGGTGGVPSPFVEYPAWVQSCSSARLLASCSGCIDAKCVFCTYASPDERDEYNAELEEAEQCPLPDPLECGSCGHPVSGCPACAQQ